MGQPSYPGYLTGDRQLALFEEDPDPVVGQAATGSHLITGTALAEYLRIPSTEQLNSYDLGRLHEFQLGTAGSRKSTGSYYTPPSVVDALLRLTLGRIIQQRMASGAHAVAAIRVVDPACGSGNFLVAAAELIARALADLGVPLPEARSTAFGQCVAGMDIDPMAVDICRFVLHRDSQGLAEEEQLVETIRVGDSLRTTEAEDHVDLVIGNPPFLSQLSSTTASAKEYRAALKRRFGDAVGGYTDPAAIFMMLAVQRARPDGGTVCLLQPLSFLASRDATAIRQSLVSSAALEAIWIATERVFDAGVDVCAPVLVRGSSEATTLVTTGADAREFALADAPTSGSSWSTYLALTRSIPFPALKSSATVGDIAEATADFRDQFYGVAPHVVDNMDSDDPGLPRLVTVGLIDPAHLMWGVRRTKIGGTQFEHPRVRVADLDPKLRRWALDRMVPKLLLATQSRVLEVIVDERGDLLPSVPVISITTDPDKIWHLAAVLTSPPVAAWAFHEYLGTALSIDALKLSSKQVKTIPLPVDQDAWQEGADAFRDASHAQSHLDRDAALARLGVSMCRAYGVEPHGPVLHWWSDRLGKSVAT